MVELTKQQTALHETICKNGIETPYKIFRSERSFVMKEAFRRMREEQMPFGQSIKSAWKDVRMIRELPCDISAKPKEPTAEEISAEIEKLEKKKDELLET